MRTSELKSQILAYMAEQYEQGQHGMVELEPLSTLLGIPFSSIVTVVDMLHQQGIVRTVVGARHAMLTPQGISVAVQSDPATPRQPPQTVNFNGPITQSAIAMNQGRANVVMKNAVIETFTRDLFKAIDQAEDLPSEKKSSWKSILLECSKHPAIAAALTKLIEG